MIETQRQLKGATKVLGPSGGSIA